MKTHRWLACALLVVIAVVTWLKAEDKQPAWWEAEAAVTAALSAEGATFVDVVRRTQAEEAVTGQDAMFRVNLFLRGLMMEEANAALVDLKEACPGLGVEQVKAIYYAAGDQYEAWATAQRVLELFGEVVFDVSLENRLIKHWEESGKPVEAIERWLGERPAGVDGFWVKERLRFAFKHGRGAGMLAALEKKARGNGTDAEAAVALLDALIMARSYSQEKADVAWMAQGVRPVTATGAERVGSRLADYEAWSAAAVMYERATKTALTAAEVTEMGRNRQAMLGESTLEAQFAAHVRRELAKCLVKAGRGEEAQRWMVEAVDIAAKHGVAGNPFIAGQVQAASGQRTIENRIVEQEKMSADDPRYWIERAMYYRGRGEAKEEEAALRQALAIAPPKAQPVGKVPTEARAQAMRNLADFLQRQKRMDEGAKLLRQELADAPADSASALAAAYLLAFDFRDGVDAGDEVLWTWLGHRPEWSHREERLLWEMVKRFKKGEEDQQFARAETLCAGAHPSRGAVLGWIMNRERQAARSIPLLKDAVARAASDELREQASFTLFESCLDTGDWRQAEAVYPQAAKRLTGREQPEWLGRLAAAAVRAGAKEDAMRIWQRAANVNPAEVRAVRELARGGLREELKVHYEQMRRELPTSGVAERALAVLEREQAR